MLLRVARSGWANTLAPRPRTGRKRLSRSAAWKTGAGRSTAGCAPSLPIRGMS